MRKLLDVLLPAGLTFWLLQLFFTVYQTMNTISRPTGFQLFLVITLGLAIWLGQRRRFWPVIVFLLGINFFFWIWYLEPLKERFSLTWLREFVALFWNDLQQFFQDGGLDMPVLLSVTLVLFLSLLLSCFVVSFHHYPFAVLVVLGYLLVVHVFAGTALLNYLVQVALITLIFAWWHRYRLRPIRQTFWPLLAVISLLGGSYLATQQTKVRDFFATQTVTLRSELNVTGFYEAISNYGQKNAKTGFSENDDQLGGAIYDDTTPIMTVLAKKPLYLRVQTKQTYTGKGWRALQPQPNSILRSTARQMSIQDPAVTAAYPKQTATIQITNNQPLSYQALPYGQLTVSAITPGSMSGLRYSTTNNRLYAYSRSFKKINLKMAEITPSITALQALPAPDTNTLSADLALPETVTARTKKLAAQIVKDSSTYYERVKAVETYLQTAPTLTYSKVDTPTTPKNRDYVDYFLFSSHLGYCDNFSTSMVVLLRSLGIPARWAKGFHPGTVIGTTKGGRTRYSIANANAHSWPEVYFGEYGWLPFEPTPGFSSERSNDSDVQSSSASSSTTESAAETSSSASSVSTSSRASAQTSSQQDARQTRVSSVRFIWVAASLIGIVLLIMLLTWPHWPAWYARWLARHLTLENYTQRYLQLLKCLRQVQKRPENWSLQRYAREIDTKLDLPNRMVQLTNSYEARVFGHQTLTEIPVTAFQAVAQQIPARRFKLRR